MERPGAPLIPYNLTHRIARKMGQLSSEVPASKMWGNVMSTKQISRSSCMFLFAGYRQTLKPQQPTEISPDDSGGDWFMSM